jgi:hypothetical protein
MEIEIIDISKANVPNVRFDITAWEKIQFIVDHESMEIGWFGTVDHDPKSNTYVITDIFITEQRRHGATCEQSAKGLNELTSEIIRDLSLSSEEKRNRLNTFNFWGHSHVNMGVSPSCEDIANAKRFAGKDFLITGIFNKKGDVRLDFWDFKNNLHYTELPVRKRWHLSDETVTKIISDINTKVKEITFEPSYSYGSQYSHPRMALFGSPTSDWNSEKPSVSNKWVELDPATICSTNASGNKLVEKLDNNDFFSKTQISQKSWMQH